mmetsp:Transcript_32878/g.129098  ORF Transcript_32878/g.129098 Transcript_32878/m.129098 type:complete len:82 (+) Transcript_32878:1072-1317(+)
MVCYLNSSFWKKEARSRQSPEYNLFQGKQRIQARPQKEGKPARDASEIKFLVLRACCNVPPFPSSCGPRRASPRDVQSTFC